MVESVVSMDVVLSNGDVATCRPQGPNKDLFRCVVGGYGLFGAIASVELKVVPNVKISMEYLRWVPPRPCSVVCPSCRHLPPFLPVFSSVRGPRCLHVHVCRQRGRLPVSVCIGCCLCAVPPAPTLHDEGACTHAPAPDVHRVSSLCAGCRATSSCGSTRSTCATPRLTSSSRA
jgi:hypothetical protein